MLALARLDYRAFGPLSLALYVLRLRRCLRASRWIECLWFAPLDTVAGTEVQPSEIAKVCTVIMLAKYFSDNEKHIDSLRVFRTSMLIAAVPAGLVLVEPDLGSAMVFGIIWLGDGDHRGRAAAHSRGCSSRCWRRSPAAIWAIAHDYQKDRIAVWLDPDKDPLGKGYNILQAEISIGSGGMFGKGFTQGTQTQLDYLRTQTTDYVFSVGAEELGFVGAMVLFALFMVLLFRCLRVAGLADDAFGR